MDTNAIVEIDEAIGLLRPDDSIDDGRSLGPAGAASSGDRVDIQRLLDRFAEHPPSPSVGGGCDLSTDVLRVWEHALAAGDFTAADRLVTLARAICAVDTRDGTAMIG